MISSVNDQAELVRTTPKSNRDKQEDVGEDGMSGLVGDGLETLLMDESA